MKAISLPKVGLFEVKVDGTVYDTHKVKANHVTYSQNVREVLFSAAAIEFTLKELLADFFVTDIKKRKLFQGVVIQSEAFSFRHAIRVVTEIIRSLNLITDKELKDLEDKLLKVMSYRNRFVHGQPLQTADNRFVCKYYNNKPCEDEMNDAFWEKLENDFKDTAVALGNLAERIPD